jgi:hypothetical protein
VIDERALGFSFYFNIQRGADARTIGHSVRANEKGSSPTSPTGMRE